MNARLHPIFDPAYFARLPPMEEPEPNDYVVGPRDFLAMQHERQLLLDNFSLNAAGEVDCFVWAVGPPPEPFLTKLGGYPFRDPAVDWPSDESGERAAFLGQLCFLDSKDLTPQAGEVLGVYALDDWRYFFEWVDVAKGDVQPALWAEPEYHGWITRETVYHYEHADQHRLLNPTKDDAWDVPSCLALTMPIAKLGNPRLLSSTQVEPESNLENCIAALPTLCPSPGAYPYCNLSEPVEPRPGELIECPFITYAEWALKIAYHSENGFTFDFAEVI